MRTRVELYEEACRIKELGHYPEAMGVEAIMVLLQQSDARMEQMKQTASGRALLHFDEAMKRDYVPAIRALLNDITPPVDPDQIAIDRAVWVDTSAHAAHRALAHRYDGSPLRLTDLTES